MMKIGHLQVVVCRTLSSMNKAAREAQNERAMSQKN